jgi:hypothetical protein
MVMKVKCKAGQVVGVKIGSSCLPKRNHTSLLLDYETKAETPSRKPVGLSFRHSTRRPSPAVTIQCPPSA